MGRSRYTQTKMYGETKCEDETRINLKCGGRKQNEWMRAGRSMSGCEIQGVNSEMMYNNNNI